MLRTTLFYTFTIQATNLYFFQKTSFTYGTVHRGDLRGKKALGVSLTLNAFLYKFYMRCVLCGDNKRF
jgi:hypothetical protein